MAIVELADVKDHLAFTDDIGSVDDGLLSRKIDAAQNHVERLLGYAIEDTFGGEGQDPVPPALEEAVLQLVAHWYEHREAAGDALRELPFGFAEIVQAYRGYTF